MKFKFNYSYNSEFNVSEDCIIEGFVILSAWSNYCLKKYINDVYIIKQLDNIIDNELYKIQSLNNFVEI